MSRRPTISDVAREAGVSRSTVSLVLQESPLVKHETRESVRAALSRVGYVYNRAAANLRSSGIGLIGIVINDLRNPFFTEFAISAQMELSTHKYAAVLANTEEDPALQAQVVRGMIEHGVSAVVISPVYGHEDETFGPLARAGVPTLQVLRRAASDTEAFPFSSPDYITGGRLATEHLLSLGCRRIAFVGGLEGRAVTRERMSGYLTALQAAGLTPESYLGRSSRAFGRETAHRLAGHAPEVDGAVCFNDLVALGMLAGFAEQGLRVGEQFRLVGFDDIEESEQSYPALSSVRCDIRGFGRRTAGRIVAWLENGDRPPPEETTPVTLVARESSLGPRRGG
ncbi:LacI family DNA-binding transcriptional regulator [Alsobacter sp. SYSU M60028]|uniref:LacI family DNA-binding transcriptional regulator n=1 Tax=Alsobacter ponti TaxID=2962936 RepID=A0ABT1L9U2_9HYPH|nr:LacI family DNA-binding transcriptional regulator [Alsobacter ponti]MCP8938262.1 LacI family DNA-binding transcriptional regulator [Alsobacter ponti]